MFSLIEKYKTGIFISGFSTISTTVKAMDPIQMIKNVLKDKANIDSIKDILNKVKNVVDPKGILLKHLGINKKDKNEIDELIANLLSDYLFPIKEFKNVECEKNTGVYYNFYEKQNKKEDNANTLIVCGHGITDNIENFSSSQESISEIFGCDSISLEYNFFKNKDHNERSNITKMDEMSNKLFEFLQDYLKKNKNYKKIIFYGYSHGNRYMINLFKNFTNLKNKEYEYTYMGDKGYRNLSQALNIIIKLKIKNIDSQFIKNITDLLGNIKDVNILNYLIRYIFGKNLYDTIVSQSNNYETLKSIKNSINVFYNKLETKGHSISENGSSEIFNFYSNNEKNKDGKYDCFLFSADDDEMVGNGFEEVYKFLTTEEEPKDIYFNKNDNEEENPDTEDQKNHNSNNNQQGGIRENKDTNNKDKEEKKTTLCCIF